MRKKFICSFAILMGGSALAFGQDQPGLPPAPVAVTQPSEPAAPYNAPPRTYAPPPIQGYAPPPPPSYVPPPPPLPPYMPPPPPPVVDFDGERCDKDPFWIRGEILVYWIKSGSLPGALVTTGSPDDFNPGALDQSGTMALFGGSRSLDYGTMGGGRLSGGYWFSPEHTLGIEGSFFTLDRGEGRFAGRSDGDGYPVLAYRYQDPPGSFEDAFQASIPGVYAGGLGVFSSSKLWGAEVNLASELHLMSNLHLALFGGFRYLNLNESLDLQFEREAIGDYPVFFLGTPYPGGIVSSVDSFHTRNQFYGGQIGARTEYRFGQAFFGIQAKLALGQNHESLNVSGSSTVMPFAGPGFRTTGGLFAQESNSGQFTRDQFCVVPELNLKLGYQVNSYLRVFMGYDFLYWSRVVRPGNQVDLVVDTSQVAIDPNYDPTAPRSVYPKPQFRQSDFWAQGLNFGIELNF